MDEKKITLDLIKEHLGEQVYFGFLVASADKSGELEPIDHRIGPLVNLQDPKPPRLEPDRGYYAIGGGGNSYVVPQLSGTVHLRTTGSTSASPTLL